MKDPHDLNITDNSRSITDSLKTICKDNNLAGYNNVVEGESSGPSLFGEICDRFIKSSSCYFNQRSFRGVYNPGFLLLKRKELTVGCPLANLLSEVSAKTYVEILATNAYISLTKEKGYHLQLFETIRLDENISSVTRLIAKEKFARRRCHHRIPFERDKSGAFVERHSNSTRYNAVRTTAGRYSVVSHANLSENFHNLSRKPPKVRNFIGIRVNCAESTKPSGKLPRFK